MSTSIGWASLQVIPTIQGVAKQVSTQIVGPLKQGGQQAGKAAGDGVAQGLKQAEAAVGAASRKLATVRDKEADAAGKVRVAEAKLAELRAKGVTDTGRLAAAEETLEKSKRAHNQATGAAEAAEVQLERARSNAKKAADNAAKGNDTLSSSAKSAAQAIDGQEKSARGAGDSLESLGAKATGAVGNLGNLAIKAVGVGAAFAGIQGIGSIFTAGWDRLTAIDNAEAKLAGLGRSGEEVASVMESVSNSVTGTAFGIGEAANSAAVFSTLGVKSGSEMDRVMKLLADTTAQAGSNFDEMTPIFSAVRAAGGLTVDTFDQLNNRATGVGEALSKHLGIPMDEVRDKAKDIDFETFATAMEKNIGGAALKTGDTVEGSMKNMKAAFSNVAATLLKPIFQNSAAFMQGIQGGVKKVNKAIGPFISDVQGKIGGLADVLIKGDFSARFREAFNLEEDSPIVGVLFTIRESIVDTFGRAKAVFTEVTGGVRAFIAAFKEGGDDITSSGFAGILERLGLIANEVFGAVRAMVLAFIDGGSDITSSGFAGYLERIGLAARWLWDNLQVVIGFIQDNVVPVFDTVAGVAMGLAAAALPMLWDAFQSGADIVGGLIDGIMSVVGWFREHDEVTIILAATLGGLMLPALLSMAGTLAANAVLWAAMSAQIVINNVAAGLSAAKSVIVTTATGAWAAAQWLLNAALAGSGIGLIIAGIAALVAVVVLIATKTTWFQTAWNAAWSGIKKAFEVVWNFIKNNWSTILAVLTGPIGIAVKMIVSNWDTISAAFQAAWDFVKGITEIFVAWVIAAWDGFIGFFTGIPGRITAVATTMWDSVTNAATIAKDWVVGKWDDMIGFVRELPGKIASAASGMWDGIKNAFRSMVNGLIDMWNGLAQKLSFTVPDIIGVPRRGERIQPIPSIPRLASGGVAGRTADGLLWGPGTGTSDSILGIDALTGMPTALVSNKEGVVTADAMANGGADLVSALNAGWTPSSGDLRALFPDLNRYATGGTVGREPYGLPLGTSGAVNVPWVDDLEAEYGLKASTYAGHQEKSGQNKGIDWFGPVDKMQSFADFLLGIGDQLEQVIWSNPTTGAKVGIADGAPVGPGTDQPGYYRNDWTGHQNHVHTRQSFAFGAVPDVAPAIVDPAEPAVPSTSSSSSSTSTEPAAPPEPEKVFSARDRLRQFGSDAGAIAVDGLIDIFRVGEYLDLADRYTIPQWDGTKTQSAADVAAGTYADQAVAPVDPAVIPESLEVQRHGAELYAYEIARVAKDMGLGAKGALIGEATAIVEAGNPLKMWANSKLPASLNLPHDAVGNNGTSTGLFQQQDFPEWGALEQRMDPAESARMFYEHFPQGWESMDPGKVAQGVQRSSLPHRYGQEMGAAQKLLDSTGVFDTGGVLPPKSLAMNLLDEPEYVLRDAHWKTAAANIGKVDELVGAGVGGGGPRVQIVNNNNQTIADQASWQRDQAQREWIQSKRYGGKP